MARSVRPEQVLAQRLSSVRRWMPSAARGDVKAVHQTRVATRRLREALPVVARGAQRRRLEKAARRMTRVLGPLRELDVALATLDELRGQPGMPRDAVARLRSSIAQERRSLQRAVRDRLHGSKLTKQRDHAAAAARKAARSASVASERPWLAVAADRCVRRARRLRAAIDRAASLYLPDRLHDVRIALKKLRYAMELASELSSTGPSGRGSQKAAGRLRTLRQAQDLLGRMHDREMLVARTRALQGSAAVPDLRLSGDLDVVVRRLENECRVLHARYVTGRAALVALCDAVEEAAGRAGRRSAA